MLESEKNFYLSTKKCRRALFDIALLQRKPPLHLFQQSPISRLSAFTCFLHFLSTVFQILFLGFMSLFSPPYFFFLLVCLDSSSRMGSWFSVFFFLLLISYSLGAFCAVYKFLQEITRLGLAAFVKESVLRVSGFLGLLEFAGIRSYVIWLERYSTSRRRHCGNTWWARNSNTSLVSFSLCWFFFSFSPWYVVQQLNPNPVHLWNKQGYGKAVEFPLIIGLDSVWSMLLHAACIYITSCKHLIVFQKVKSLFLGAPQKRKRLRRRQPRTRQMVDSQIRV